MTFLLDVNLLIALIDVLHVSHEAAHDWFAREGREHWATCPITENSLVRILSNPKYPNAATTPREVLELLAHLLSSGQITDTYLLALAVAKVGKLATLDRRLTTLAVRTGADSLHVIGNLQ